MPALPSFVQALGRAGLVLLLLAACRGTDPLALRGDGVFALPGATPDRHRLRYVDGQVSLNDSCAIQLQNRLNHRIPPLYVNGEPVGFC